MGLNFSTMIYLPCMDMFARPIVIVPLISQPGAPAYGARGIWDERELNVVAADGTIFQDHDVIIDIREAEFSVLPMQGDHVLIGADADVPAEGEYVISNRWRNGGGEMTLTLSKYTPGAIPMPTLLGPT
jgi:hypothetical protein